MTDDRRRGGAEGVGPGPGTDDGRPTTDGNNVAPVVQPPPVIGRASSVVGRPSSVVGAQRLRVLQVITHSFGGAAEHVLSLTAGLQAHGHNCTLAFAPGEPLDDAFAATGARLVNLRMRRTIDLPAL